jgi:ribosomal protein S18 acetylase RimI-like enzyme
MSESPEDRFAAAAQHAPRAATVADAGAVARLLHDFNAEYDEPTPPVPVLAERLRELLTEGELHAMVAGEEPVGFTLYHLRRSVWSEALDAYLQELYVVPALRGRGIGRALLEATIEAIRAAGADHIDLNTGETDEDARSLYETLGFTNRESSADGPRMLYYERDL